MDRGACSDRALTIPMLSPVHPASGLSFLLVRASLLGPFRCSLMLSLVRALMPPQGLCDEVIGLVCELPPSLRTKLAPTHRYLRQWS
jgi:hypothetical protein